MILVDRASKSISENRWYILPGPTGIVELTPGPEAAQRPDDVLGEVVIIVRPPKRTVPQGANKTSIQM